MQVPKTCCAIGASIPGLDQDEERSLTQKVSWSCTRHTTFHSFIIKSVTRKSNIIRIYTSMHFLIILLFCVADGFLQILERENEDVVLTLFDKR